MPEDYLAVDLSALSESCECRVDGLIGMDFFRDRIVQIDFAAGSIRLLAAPPVMPAANRLSLKVRSGALCVPVSANGAPARWVRLDTGCASSLQWVTHSPEAERHEQRIAIGLSKLSVAVARTTVQLGAARFREVRIDVHQKPLFANEAGLLGNGLLARFRSVTIDAKGGQLLLESKAAEDSRSPRR